MLSSLLKQSFFNQKKAMSLMIVSVAMGTAITASLITIAFDIKGKVSRELRSFGANITLEPKIEGFADIAGQKRYLREQDVVKAKTIFWRHNILGVVPFLEEKTKLSLGEEEREVLAVGTWFEKELPLPGEAAGFKAGVDTVSPWWEVKGSHPSGKTVLLGVSLAGALGARAGDEVLIDGTGYIVSGTLSTGGKEDNQLFMDLASLQELKGREGNVSRVLVSALTTPMDEFAYKDPDTMSSKEYEKWYCTGYVTSIAKQLEEVFKGSRAKPIWQVAETEGKVLGRLTLLIYLLTAAALIASSLGVSTTMAASLLRRLDEIGLMKSIGADTMGISAIFLTEALIIGAVGGLAGYLMSIGVSQFIGYRVFDTAITERALLLPVALISATGISVLGSLAPIRRALKVKPAIVLKGAE
jgi:putative ABC transport system permease protein